MGEVRRFFREFALRQVYFMNVLNELEGGKSISEYKSTPPKPGYPFTGDNWNLPTPEVADARRTAMFQKAGYNSWGEYSSTVSFADRKVFWDDNPDLWDVGI